MYSTLLAFGHELLVDVQRGARTWAQGSLSLDALLGHYLSGTLWGAAAFDPEALRIGYSRLWSS